MRYLHRVMARLFAHARSREHIVGYIYLYYIHYMFVGIPMHLGDGLLCFLW